MPYVENRGSKWRVRWSTGKKDANGRWIYDQKGGFDDEGAAFDFGLDRESDVRNGRYISRSDGAILMKDYCKEWPDTQDVGHLRKRNLRAIIRLYIIPQWGETPVGDIKPTAWRSWKIWLGEQPNIGHRYGQEILNVFSMIMDDAVDDDLRSASPVQRKNRHRGKYKKKPREKKSEMLIEDVHQLALNALCYWGLPGYVFVLTMAFTGMRPAELYALRREYSHPAWPASDPDEEQRKEGLERYASVPAMPAIRVLHQHQWKDGSLSLEPPKYESYRTLVIPQFLAELLELLHASHDSEWTFPAINGGELAKANFSYFYWRKIADGQKERKQKAKGVGKGQGGSPRWLPGWDAVKNWAGKRLYLMRHGHKEWIDEDGHSRIATETRMGHELAGVEGLYANVTTKMERAVMDTLQGRWLRFVATLDGGWVELSPSPLPVDLEEWMKVQAKAAAHMGQ
ncbi:integrase [Streptomyces sp. NPDC087850]|uniref:integrase n=1 Tax=Streptomyces sp. NPDC087850 TaxID=3365809 RepID=UPI00381F0C63